MNALEQYLSYKKALTHPSFDSEDDARDNLSIKDGENRRFLIRGPLGSYKVCYAYMAQVRGSDDQQWASNEEYTFTHGQMYTAKNRAALEIGLESIKDTA